MKQALFSRTRCLTILLVVMLSAVGARPLFAARVGSFLYFWFDPQVIFNDGISSTTLRITTDNKDIAKVFLQAAGGRWLQLYDDGSHGDHKAGDGKFSLNKITSDTLGISAMPLRFGGTHASYGFKTKIVKKSGAVQTHWEVGIGLVDKNQAFTPVQKGTGLFATPYAFFIVDPGGKTLGAKIPIGKVRCGDVAFLAFQKLYSVFPDIFDFVVVMPAAQIFDPSRNYAENVPYEITVKNRIRNIGLPLKDNTEKFFSKGRLQSMIYHSFGYGPILDHEIGHRWVMAFGERLGLSNGMHWEKDTDIGGQMSEYVFLPRKGHLVDNGDGSWRIEPPDDANHPYSKLDLYLMGLIPPSQVPPIHKLINPDYSNPDRVIAESVKTYTIQQVMQAEGGQRNPVWTNAPHGFRLALIAVKNKAFKPAEYAWFSLVAKYFGSQARGDLSLTTFYNATGRRGTLNARLPVESR